MGYDPEVFETVKRRFASRKGEAETAASVRTAELEEKLPALRALHASLSSAAPRVYAESRRGKGGLAARIQAIRQENLALQKERRTLLAQAGYPEDFLDPHYACPRCRDTGLLDDTPGIPAKLCTCMRRALYEESVASSGFAPLLRKQTFENFDLSYYPKDSPMENYLRMCKQYARDPKGNLLLLGGTGLGKTHLSSAIAGEALRIPLYVVYESAPTLFGVFERERFSRNSEPDGEMDGRKISSKKYFECELLILDDLGAEMITSYTKSVLYELLCFRLNREAPTVINSNLSFTDLQNNYASRITSRLLGEFRPLILGEEGTDIRCLKVGITRAGEAPSETSEKGGDA